MSVTTTSLDLSKLNLSEYDTPGRGRGLVDVVKYHYLLRLLISKTTSLRYRNSVLGWIWSYARPTVQFLLYWLVLGELLGMHKNVKFYPIYMLAGLVIVNLFNEAFNNTTRSIVENKALVRKIYLPREMFPISAAVSAFINFLPQVAILLFVSILNGWRPTFGHVALMLAALAVIMPFVLGLGLIFSAINVRYRDAQNVVEIVRTVATWASPVIYTWESIYEHVHGFWGSVLFNVYMSNPVTVAVELFHRAFWAPIVPSKTLGGQLPPHMLAYGISGFAASVVIIVIGQLVFRRYERTFAQDL